MSVKFEKETIKHTGGVAGTHGPPALLGGRHDLADEIGTALTGGKTNSRQPGYLSVSLPASISKFAHLYARSR
jgi:hypothetical protein